MKHSEKTKIVIDVTKPPYSADNTGKTDCTEILKRVYSDIIEDYKNSDHAYSGNIASKIMFFPKGTYLVSDTIMYNGQSQNNGCANELNFKIGLEGENMEQTVIKLKDNAKGFEYGQIRSVINFHLAPQSYFFNCANEALLDTFCNITIDCGKENPGAIGIKYYADNTANVQNVTIKSSDSKYEGFAAILFTGPEAGNFDNVKINGFDYGVILTLNTPKELFEKIDMENQHIDKIFKYD